MKFKYLTPRIKLYFANKDEYLFRLQMLVSILGVIQSVIGLVGLNFFYFAGEEFTPRIKNYMDPAESQMMIMLSYGFEIMFGLCLVAVWEPLLKYLKLWIFTMLIGVFLTTFSFLWYFCNYAFPPAVDQLIFTTGMLLHLVEILTVSKFVDDYTQVKAEAIRFNKMRKRVQQEFESKRDVEKVVISVIPTN